MSFEFLKALMDSVACDYVVNQKIRLYETIYT